MLRVDRVGDRRSWGNVARNFRPIVAAAPGSRDLADRIAALERELHELRQQQRVEADGRLLRAIVLAVRGRVFDVHDLFACIPLQPDLRDALAGYTKNALGRRLMQLTNRECGGLVVQFVERERAGRVYVIVARHPDASINDRDGA